MTLNKLNLHSSELLLSLYIACKQVRQCHECYSKSNGTIPELCAAFKKSHEVFVYGGSKNKRQKKKEFFYVL